MTGTISQAVWSTATPPVAAVVGAAVCHVVRGRLKRPGHARDIHGRRCRFCSIDERTLGRWVTEHDPRGTREADVFIEGPNPVDEIKAWSREPEA